MIKPSRFSGFTPSGGGGGGVVSVTVDAGELTDTGTPTAPVLGLAAAGTPGTYAYPSSVTTDAFGRVTTVVAGTAPFVPGAAFLRAFFGIGFDGNVTIAPGTTTLSREMQYDDLTIQAGATLKPNGFRIFVLGTLTIEAGGSINDDGNAASGLTPGAPLGLQGYLRAAGASASAGRSTTGAGPGSSTSPLVSPNNAGIIPRGGFGGTAGGLNTGGIAGNNSFMQPSQAWHTQACWGAARANAGPFSSGNGGAGGGCDIANGTASSGAGGGAAGVVWVAAHTIVNSGTISANGGAGGNGTVTSGLGSAGGGGGGCGGLVAVITAGTIASAGTVQVNGGAGGTGAGPLGGAGLPGTSGASTVLRLA